MVVILFLMMLVPSGLVDSDASGDLIPDFLLELDDHTDGIPITILNAEQPPRIGGRDDDSLPSTSTALLLLAFTGVALISEYKCRSFSG